MMEEDQDDTQTVDSGDQGGGSTPPAIPPAPIKDADYDEAAQAAQAAAPGPDEQAPITDANTYDERGQDQPVAPDQPVPGQLTRQQLDDAVDAAERGMSHAKRKWGVDPDQPPAMMTPQVQQAIKNYMSAPDAYSLQDATKIEDAADPTHQLNDHGRGLAGLSAAAYEHGAAGANAFVGHKRSMFDVLAGAAQHAADSMGSPRDWVKHMGEALSNVPSPIEWAADMGGVNRPTAVPPKDQTPDVELTPPGQMQQGADQTPDVEMTPPGQGSTAAPAPEGATAQAAIPERGSDKDITPSDELTPEGQGETTAPVNQNTANRPAWAYITGKDPTTGEEVARFPVQSPQQAAEFAQHGFDQVYKAAKDPATMEQAVNTTPAHVQQTTPATGAASGRQRQLDMLSDQIERARSSGRQGVAQKLENQYYQLMRQPATTDTPEITQTQGPSGPEGWRQQGTTRVGGGGVGPNGKSRPGFEEMDGTARPVNLPSPDDIRNMQQVAGIAGGGSRFMSRYEDAVTAVYRAAVGKTGPDTTYGGHTAQMGNLLSAAALQAEQQGKPGTANLLRDYVAAINGEGARGGVNVGAGQAIPSNAADAAALNQTPVIGRNVVGVPPAASDTSTAAAAAHMFPGSANQAARKKYQMDLDTAVAKQTGAETIQKLKNEGADDTAKTKATSDAAKIKIQQQNADTNAAKARALETYRAAKEQGMTDRDIFNQKAISHRAILANGDYTGPDDPRYIAAVKVHDQALDDLLPQRAAAPAQTQTQTAMPPAATAQPPAPQSQALQRRNYPNGQVWEQRTNPATGKPGWIQVK